MKTRGGKTPDRYKQKWQIMAVGGGGRGCCRRINIASDGDIDGGDDDDGRGMEGYYCKTITKSGLRSRYSWSSDMKKSRDTAASRALTKRSRSRSR